MLINLDVLLSPVKENVNALDDLFEFTNKLGIRYKLHNSLYDIKKHYNGRYKLCNWPKNITISDITHEIAHWLVGKDYRNYDNYGLGGSYISDAPYYGHEVLGKKTSNRHEVQTALLGCYFEVLFGHDPADSMDLMNLYCNNKFFEEEDLRKEWKELNKKKLLFKHIKTYIKNYSIAK